MAKMFTIQVDNSVSACWRVFLLGGYFFCFPRFNDLFKCFFSFCVPFLCVNDVIFVIVLFAYVISLWVYWNIKSLSLLLTLCHVTVL